MFKCKTVRQTNTDARNMVKPSPAEPAEADRHNCPSVFSNKLHGRIWGCEVLPRLGTGASTTTLAASGRQS